MTDTQKLEHIYKVLQNITEYNETSTALDEESKKEIILGIENDIVEYEERIEALKQKMAQEGAYYTTEPALGKSAIEEIAKDNIQKERENLYESRQKHQKSQEKQGVLLAQYNKEAEVLKETIRDIKRRLQRSEHAKNSGVMTLVLPAEEIVDLEKEIEDKEKLLTSIKETMDFISDEIRDYGKLINQDIARLKELDLKEIRLSKIEVPSDIVKEDAYARRLDQDEISKLERAIQAAKKRRERLLYDPFEEIKKLVEAGQPVLEAKKAEEPAIEPKNEVTTETKIEEPKDTFENYLDKQKEYVEENQEAQNNVEVKNEVVEEEANDYENVEPENSSEDNLQNDEVEQAEIDLAVRSFLEKMREQQSTEEQSTEEQATEEKTEEEKEDIKLPEGAFYGESSEENNIEPEENTKEKELLEIEPASDELKKEKLSDDFKKLWNKWSKIVVAAVVAKYQSIKKSFSDEKNDIPEVEMEQDNIRTSVLTLEESRVYVDLENGESALIKYGDTQENAPDGVTIKYEGPEMIVTYPIVRTHRRK